nr:histidine kinase [Bacillus sp. FJAT-50079]
MLKEEVKDEWEAYTEARFFADYSNQLLVGHPEVSKITIYNFKNKRLDSLGRFLPLKEEDNIVKELKQQFKYAPIAKSSIQIGELGQPFISFGREIIDLNTGRPIGIAVLDYNLDYLMKEFDEIKLLKSGYVILLDENYDVIYQPNKKIANKELYKKILAHRDQKILLTKNEKGEDSLYLKNSIPSLNWYLIGVVPYDEVLEKLKPIHYEFYFFIIIILLTILIVAITLHKLFVKPIRKLQFMMNKVQTGDFSVRVHFNRNDEIAQLGDSFNMMVIKVEELIDRVYQVEINESRALLLQKQAELEALQEKITPHFLYNTLNSISWVANRRGVREIEGIVHSLSNLLRYSLEDPSKIVTLKEELDYLMMYGEIINFRYDQEIEFIYEIDSSVDKAIIPRLTIQPIVENVMKHAFENIDDVKRIIIKAYRVKDLVIIDVVDNGKGISNNKLKEIDQKLNQPIQGPVDRITEVNKYKYQKSMGLINVQHRIKLFFGEDYGIEVKKANIVGTMVRIIIPYKTE